MQRINSDHYLYNGYAIYQETMEFSRYWTVYKGCEIVFLVPFGQFDLIESIIDNMEKV